jgi:ribulose-phosphate 3-epimerase
MIIPVILEESFEGIKKKVQLIDFVAKVIQIDFADGNLVDGKTFLDIYKLDEIKTDAEFDIHLMVKDPITFLDRKVHRVFKICSQIEADFDVANFIERARELEYLVGLSLNFETDIDTVEKYVSDLDFVQFVSVEPGGQGRKFHNEVIEKIGKFRERHSGVKIQVDGGIKKDIIPKLLNAGVNDVVIGSAIWKSENPKEEFIKLREIK